jgi:hypothetical protein
MPFRSGAISYRRFAVSGEAPNLLKSEFYDALRENALGELEPIKPGETHVGWTAGRHLFDRSFDYERVGFGGGALLGLRIDTVRVPPEIKKAYVAMAEEARLEPSKDGSGAYLSRTAKKEAREDALRRIDEEISEGRYRRPKHTPLFWDFAASTVYGPISADTEVQALRRLFIDSLDLAVAPRTAGTAALDILAAKGRTSDYDDLRAEPLSSAPPEIELAREDGSRASAERPELPWTSNEPQDFLGNLFLFWLWWQCDAREGLVETASGEVAIAIDRVLDLECAWGLSGRTSLRGDAPTRRADRSHALKLRPRLGVLASGRSPRGVGAEAPEARGETAVAAPRDRGAARQFRHLRRGADGPLPGLHRGAHVARLGFPPRRDARVDRRSWRHAQDGCRRRLSARLGTRRTQASAARTASMKRRMSS